VPSFARFKEDKTYQGFGMFYVWKALELDDAKKESDAGNESAAAPKDDPATVVFRYSNGKPAVAARKIDGGQVLLVSMAAEPVLKDKTGAPTWTDWQLYKQCLFAPFVDIAVNHLLHDQSQTYNLVAGTTLRWHPNDALTRAYTLHHPDGTSVRLGLPEKSGNRTVVTADDLRAAGVYRLTGALVSGAESLVTPPGKTSGTPLAVTPDLGESDDLESLSAAQLDARLGFAPNHVTAGLDAGPATATERWRREWTMWLLMAVLALTVAEGLLAWWCGRAW
jgi:hypothetical protein